MKIEIKKNVLFNLKRGDVFTFPEDSVDLVYLLVKEATDGNCTAVLLNTGELNILRATIAVTLYSEAKLILDTRRSE